LTADLFESIPDVCPAHESMAEGAVLLRGFAVPLEADLLAGLRDTWSGRHFATC
jgi:alkylated DNA repair protein (DNA oxidative demethylase)